MMRGGFDKQLSDLYLSLIEMGAMCETAISNVVIALECGDQKLAKDVIALDDRIDDQERLIESACMKILLRQQPVAKDFRQVSSALKMITDMERIGDQAADIAEITRFADISSYSGKTTLYNMAKAAIKMVTDSIDAFVRADLELANAVIKQDDVVDEYFNEIKLSLIDLIGTQPEKGELAIDLIMIAKYLERIGDHATNIAEWVEYSITGQHRGEND